ncbi:hypothetical protein [Actinomadura rudentiformis]|uniref:Uncharacterized protein n=1 Tax=Actinomadura rudentiformis TaxID=359158 RepID=A0A6H9YLN9_9ACTN|nr:hypothetical protein [Actinomadura rudentiformis]KAB2342190.1 hypothetical protein F8566_39730 [Actinomadura rudentiformis]
MSQAERRERSFDVHNEAGDHATIGVQGIVYGDVRYEVQSEDPPEKKFWVAKNCLAGGMPRRAEELIREVFQIGFPNPPSTLANEIAYHWVIAVLGDRSFELLGNDEFGDIERARTLAANGPADDWHQAFDVLLELVDCLRLQERTGRDDPERLDAFFAEFDRLPQERREEIRRHLDLILTGAIQDHLDSRFAEVVRQTRTGDGRVDRVWKFFEPDPAEPRPIPVREPGLELFEETAAMGGALLGAAAIILSHALLALLSVKAAAIAGTLFIVGGGLLAFSVPSYFPKRYSAFSPQNTGPKDPDFESQIRASVRRLFSRRAPEAALQRSGWNVATGRFQSRLADEFIDLYSKPEIEPGAIDWLIDWHAKESTRRWKAGEFKDSRRIAKWLGLVPGAAIVVLTWLYMFSAILELESKITMVVIFWFLGGVLLLALGQADVFLWSRITYRRNKAEAETRTRKEREAYERRRALLADRPGDADMARWLDYDKIYLKRLAMNQHGLGNRDIIAHAILTEAAPNARRARFSNGPPRFSAYQVWIFLLTSDGVRQITVRLDFPTGIARDQQRTEFRYDVIAAARVTEIGLRFDDGHREIILPRADRDENRRDAPSTFILFQEFRLSLVSGNEISITVENLDEWILQDDQNHVPDNSEFTGALRILEAVAADGRDWIERARKRRDHRSYSHTSPNGDRP